MIAMKKLFLIISIFSVISLYSQDDADIVLAISPDYVPNFVSEYTSLLFSNINVSNNSPAPQNEPSIKINRLNPNIVVAAWRDFRLDYTTPERRIGYTYSTNGGMTWAPSLLLPNPNPNHTSQSDPVLTCDASGNFYISSTSRQPVSGYNRDMLIYKSTNNGQTFVEYSIAVPGTGGAGEDKEWIFCDPISSNSTYNNIFITWTSFGPSTGIKFRKSTNGGLNWSATVPIGDNGNGQGSNNCSGTNGQIYVVWDGGGVRFDKSTNGGTSFGTDFSLSTSSTLQGFPFICCDYSNRSTRGNVYVIWDDTRNGNSDVWFQRSTNAGANWLSAPVRVNDVTTNSQMWPVIRCDTNGTLYALYYDNRTGTSAWNTYIAYSTDAGNTWVNQQLSDSSFAMTQTNGDVRYGDYIDMDVFNGVVLPVWTDQRKGVPNQEIYSARLTNIVGISGNTNEIPVEYLLHQNYPNPFNPSTEISFSIPKSSLVSLKVYDVLGNQVAELINENKPVGNYAISFNAANLSSGIYFYTIKAGDFTDTKKMMLIK